MRKLLADLFKTPGNQSWELARFLAAWAVASFSFAFLWQLIRNGTALDFASLGTGYGLVLAGAGALIWAKDTARTAAVNATQPSPPPPPVTVGPHATVNVGGEGR